TDDSIQKRPGGSPSLNKIVSIFFPNTPFIDTSGTFETSIVEENDEKINGDTIKYGKPNYTEKNIVTNSLIMINRFGQTISKDVPKAPRLKLHGFFCQIDMNIVLNTKSNDGIPLYDDIKLYEPPGDFIVTLSLLIAKDKTVKDKDGNDVNIFLKENI
ncbi:16009_t:CDS:1, partial [Cetraspora pellucida]